MYTITHVPVFKIQVIVTKIFHLFLSQFSVSWIKKYRQFLAQELKFKKINLPKCEGFYLSNQSRKFPKSFQFFFLEKLKFKKKSFKFHKQVLQISFTFYEHNVTKGKNKSLIYTFLLSFKFHFFISIHLMPKNNLPLIDFFKIVLFPSQKI